MGDHHRYSHQQNLRQLLNGSTHFQGTPQVTDPIFFYGRNLSLEQPAAQTHYDPIMVGGLILPSGLVKLGHDGHDHYCTNPANVITSAAAPFSSASATVANTDYSGAGRTALYGVELMDTGWVAGNDHGGINSRWPRQETLALLDIRSRLDSKFKEANQKGPLWDEVSRTMAEEHGYRRSGRKCREKFENLYKYYKKTREGKAGRQDGKHYRFFRQLEALYGETSNEASVSQPHHLVNNPLLYQAPANKISQETMEPPFAENKHSDSLSLSNNSEFDQTSSSENNDDNPSAIARAMKRSSEKQKGIAESRSYTRAKNRWKSKVKNFVDSEMRKVFETQEAWMERTLKTIEDRENKRMYRDEEWMKQEFARFDQEHEFWAKELQWIEARDAALMESLKTCAGKQLGLSLSVDKIAPETDHTHEQNQKINAETIRNGQEISGFRWTEAEIISLIQLRAAVDAKFQEDEYPRERLWGEIAANMASMGYDRSMIECKEKWDNMNIYFNMTTERNRRRKGNLTTDNYLWELETYNGQENEKQLPETMNNIAFGSGSDRVTFRFQ